MPSEIRHIKFEKEEVLHAIKEYWTWKKEDYDSNHVENFTLLSEPDISAKVKFDIEEGQKEVILSGDVLSTAIVLFCINRKIPLPVNSKKSIRLFKDDLILIVNLGKTKP